jgi:hypothetical protein
MTIRKKMNAMLLCWMVVAGCENSPDADLKTIRAPVENGDAEANTFHEWQPTEEQLASLATIKAECEGNLSKLLDHAKWSGYRMRVTGMSDGLPETEEIGPWHIFLVPTSDQSVIEIKGLHFARGFTVKLDVNRDVLIIKDVEFKGRPLKGNSPMFQNAPFQGVVFKGELGLVMGSASILFLDDGRLCMDFHKVIVNGTKAGEYGVLEPPDVDN